MRRRDRAPLLAAVMLVLPAACGRGGGRPIATKGDAGRQVVAAPTSSANSRPGMVFIPPGLLRAGTSVNDTPRVAEEELPGADVTLDGYYIDRLPFPNEEGAIATTNVTRDDAAAMCATQAKRLCTELEWERACKGPQNQMYDDGNDYHAATCAMGTPAERSAKRPTGELTACTSGFGVREMHGGAWEWTQSAWGRGSRRDLGVLRGGNALAGEIAGRCANALARPPSTKSPSMGFRCCAGRANDAKVELAIKVGPALERTMKTAEMTRPWLSLARATWSPRSPEGAPFEFVHAFTWRPVGNEALVVGSGCARDLPHPRCGLIVGRASGDELAEAGDAGPPHVLATIDTGFEASEVAEAGEARHLRLKGSDATSAFLRDFTYAYGLIELGDVRR